MYDLIIIGSGPAGLSACVYALRAKLNVLIIEKNGISGGQIVSTDRVDNYLGMYGVSGFEMGMSFRKHADELGAVFKNGEVEKINEAGEIKEVVLRDGTVIEGKTVIVATGATHRKLKVPGEKELTGAGVSYCATCDGAFFRGKDVVCVGGGDVALEDALYLSKLCNKVYLVHRRDEFRASKSVQDQVISTENIQFIPNAEVKEILGNARVEKVILEDINEGNTKELDVSGIFIAVGMMPDTELVENLVEMDEKGYIKAGEDCVTSRSGIFVAGDVRTKRLRQVITAVADGANAVRSVEDFLR